MLSISFLFCTSWPGGLLLLCLMGDERKKGSKNGSEYIIHILLVGLIGSYCNRFGFGFNSPACAFHARKWAATTIILKLLVENHFYLPNHHAKHLRDCTKCMLFHEQSQLPGNEDANRRICLEKQLID
jgi:hypothetical protein